MKLTETDLRQHIAQRHSPLVTRCGDAPIDTDLLLASGAIEGPARLTTVSSLRRLVRRITNFLKRQ